MVKRLHLKGSFTLYDNVSIKQLILFIACNFILHSYLILGFEWWDILYMTSDIHHSIVTDIMKHQGERKSFQNYELYVILFWSTLFLIRKYTISRKFLSADIFGLHLKDEITNYFQFINTVVFLREKCIKEGFMSIINSFIV